MLREEREGLKPGRVLSFLQVKAAVIVILDNHPAPSGLKNLLIEAGLISCGRNRKPCLQGFNYPLLQGSGADIPLEMTGLAEIISTIFLLFSSIPSPFHPYWLGGGKRTGGKNPLKYL